MAKTYCLVLAANPYSEVMVAECDATGSPNRVQRYRSYGTTVSLASGLRTPNKGAGTKEVIEVYSPHSVGGFFDAVASSVLVIDPTPRAFDDAVALASRAPRGSHVRPTLTADAARSILASSDV